MTHQFTQQLIDFLTEAGAVNLATTPAFIFKSKLRGYLIFCGLSSLDAETIVMDMQVEIPSEALDDEDIDKLAVLYCKLIVNARVALVDAGFEHVDTMLNNISNQFTLKLS